MRYARDQYGTEYGIATGCRSLAPSLTGTAVRLLAGHALVDVPHVIRVGVLAEEHSGSSLENTRLMHWPGAWQMGTRSNIWLKEL